MELQQEPQTAPAKSQPPSPPQRLLRLLTERRHAIERARYFHQPLFSGLLWPVRRARGTATSLWHEGRMRALGVAGHVLGVNRVVLPLPAFRGVFEMDLRSHVTRNLLLGHFEGAFLPLIEAALGQGQGGDAVDVGANVGLYTVLCARLLGGRGRVLAVEPAQAALSLLQANIARNRLSNVTVFSGAVSDQAGSATLHVPQGNEEYASLGGVTHPSAPQASSRAAVPTETLDALVSRHGLRPCFIKIDTEGAEGLVLGGATEVLRQHRPVLLCELDDRLLPNLSCTSISVRQLLRRHGYRVFDAHNGAELGVAEPHTFIGEIVALPSAAAAG